MVLLGELAECWTVLTSSLRLHQTPLIPPTMPSLRSTVLAAAFVAATYADYIIDPSTVSKSMRSTFCSKPPECRFAC